MNKVPMTTLGAQKVRDELEALKRVERPRITAAIAEARAHGDLKENAEYHAAKEQQGFTEARIRDLEAQLAHAQIIDVTTMKNDGKVIFGSTVQLVHCETDAEVKYQIVGEAESDVSSNKISVTSPIARAMIGKHEGDVIEVNSPSGLIEYEILEVKYV